MTRQNLAGGLVLVLLLAAAAASPTGSAEAQAASNAALARQLRSQGVDAARGLEWDRARELFQRSYELAPRPLTLYNLAVAEANSSRVVSASEHFRQFLRNTTEGEYPDFRREAASQREQLQDRIPYARIVVDGIRPGDRAALNGESLPHAALGERIPVEPGHYAIEIQRRGAVVGRSEFDVEEGASVDVEVTVESGPAAVAAAGTGGAGADGDLGDADGEPNEYGYVDAGYDEGWEDAEPVEEGPSVFVSPVFWTIVGVLVAGAAVATTFVIVDSNNPETTTLGTIDIN